MNEINIDERQAGIHASDDEDLRIENASDGKQTPGSFQDASSVPKIGSMAFHHYFGRPGRLQAVKSTPWSWNRDSFRPLKRTIQVPWGLEFGQAQLARLLHGYTPEIMEDKWFVYAEGPDSSGAAKVYFLRSWTGKLEAVLDVQVNLTDWTGQIVSMTIEKDIEVDVRVHMATCDEKEVLSGLEVMLPQQGDVVTPEAGDTAEDHMKFQVLMVLRRVLQMDVDEIVIPPAWLKAYDMPAVPPHVCRAGVKTYRGLKLSKETEEDIENLGGMEEMFKQTTIAFTT